MTVAKRRIELRLDSGMETDLRGGPSSSGIHRILVVERDTKVIEAYREIFGSHSSIPSNVIPIQRASSSSALNGSPSLHEIATPMVELTVVHSPEQAVAEVKHALKTHRPFTMGFFGVLLGGGLGGVEVFKAIHAADPELYAIFVMAAAEKNVDSIQGTFDRDSSVRWDYIRTPFSKGEILQKVRNGVSLWCLRRETERKDDRLCQVQRQLLETERLASIEAVARGIGHEFRNILTLITGKAELGAKAGTEGMKEAFAQILMASDRANEILQRFHFLCNPTEQKVQKKTGRATQPIDEALVMMKPQFSKHGIKVCWIRRKPVDVEANFSSLLRVFVNLFMNSIHAMNGSGQIDLSVVELEGFCEIRVRDYGPGIDPAVLPRATEPFFTTKGERGTGLGLSIVREIIEAEHGGDLELLNHEVKGLEIVIRIPKKSEPDTKKS